MQQVSVAAIWRDGGDAGGAFVTFELAGGAFVTFELAGREMPEHVAMQYLRDTIKHIGRDLLSETGERMRQHVLDGHGFNWGDAIDMLDNDDLAPYGLRIVGVNGMTVVEHDEALMSEDDLPAFAIHGDDAL